MSFKIRAAAISALLALSVPSSAQEKENPEEFKETFEAFAVAMGTSNPPVIPTGVATTLQINITRWTTDEERDSLFAILVEKGQESLVEALQKQEETGWIRVTGRGAGRGTFPSERLRYARQWDRGEGRRRIVLALDRPISFYEAARNPRWRDYDVTLIVLDVDAEGNGEGQLAMAVKLSLEGEENTLVVESFGTEPVRLKNVHKPAERKRTRSGIGRVAFEARLQRLLVEPSIKTSVPSLLVDAPGAYV